MKIVHFADVHLDIQRGPIDPDTHIHRRIMDFLSSLDKMVAYIEKNDVDIVVFAGDAFHTPHPSQTHINLFAKRIRRITEICPVIIIPGNHDMPGPKHKASVVDVFQSLEVPNVIVGNDCKLHVIETKSGKIQVATIPYPIRHHLLVPEQYYGKPKEEMMRLMQKKLHGIIKSLYEETDPEFPSILVGHFSTTTAVFGSERTMILGFDAEINLRDLMDWDYVALGHIHDQQILCEDPLVAYSGSLDRVDFGEENADKGFMVVTISQDFVNWEFVSTNPRPLKTIRVDVCDCNRTPTDEIIFSIDSEDLKGKIVRLLVLSDDETYHRINVPEIHQALEDSEVYYVHAVNISRKSTMNIRLDLEDPIQTYTSGELLEMYLESMDISDKMVDECLDIGEEIISEVEMEKKK